MGDMIISILQWLIPSGGLGAVFIWFTNRTLRNVRTTKEVHDTYKIMYQDIQETLVEIQSEKRELQKLVSRMEKLVNYAFTCRYNDACPVIREMRQHKGECDNSSEGFAAADRKTNRIARDYPDQPGDINYPTK